MRMKIGLGWKGGGEKGGIARTVFSCTPCIVFSLSSHIGEEEKYKRSKVHAQSSPAHKSEQCHGHRKPDSKCS